MRADRTVPSTGRVSTKLPDRPPPSVDGETVAIPRPSTSPRIPYQVRATLTSRAVREPLFLTRPDC